MSCRTARSFFDVIPDGAPCFTDVIPDGPQGRAGIQTGTSQDDWIPVFAGMTAKTVCSLIDVIAAGARFSDVIPDGPQGRAGIQTGTSQDDWIPASAGMTA